MSTSSATGRRPARRARPRGPARIIPLPTPRNVRRRRALRVSAALVIAALGLAIAVRVYLIRTSRPRPEDVGGVSEPESAILQMVNAERARRNLAPLALSPRLAVVARGHSYDMAIRHYRGRKSPDGSTPADRVRGVGIKCNAVGETIYVDDYRSFEGLAERSLKGWLASAEHRAVMLSPDFTESGVGIARSSDGYLYVTQDFAR